MKKPIRKVYRRRKYQRPVLTKKAVKSIVAKELRSQGMPHNLDLYNAGVILTSTASVTQLTDIDQAALTTDTTDNRLGEHIYVKSISSKFRYGMTDSSPAQAGYRVIFFYIKDKPAATIAATDILDTTTIANPLLAPYTLGTSANAGVGYHIIMDRTFYANGVYSYDGTSPTVVLPRKSFSHVVRFPKGHKIEYESNLGSDAGLGNIYMLLVGDTATDSGTLAYGIRIKYVDA